MNCTDCKTHLPDLLLDPSAASSPALTNARAHLESCAACAQELHSLQATFALLDCWEAPEPSAYFDQKLAVRLREEQARPAENWFERIHSYLLFNTGRQLRPAMGGGALALVLLIAGGTFAGINGLHGRAPQSSATVNDLQIFDRNAQAVQQMDQLLQDADSPDELPAPPES